ncbi:MAG TPA: VOC family protein [Acidimicrobiales bacterium]|nr:VOC family protein [Acidimicrobiales bacterium]
MTAIENAEPDTATRPAWSGINHLALITADMDATVRFYCGVLGARIAATVGTTEFRHYFFEFGPQCTVAFFEYAELTIEPFAKPAGVPDARATQFDHLALNLPDERSLHGLRRRLIAAGCEVTEIVEHSSVHSVYFTDNNGIALEASFWVRDVTGRPTDYEDPEIYSDPDPVPALRELRATGALSSVSTPRPA